MNYREAEKMLEFLLPENEKWFDDSENVEKIEIEHDLYKYEFKNLTFYEYCDLINLNSIYKQVTKKSFETNKTQDILYLKYLLDTAGTITSKDIEVSIDGYWISKSCFFSMMLYCCKKDWLNYYFPQTENNRGFIYFFTDIETNKTTIECKIGRSKNMKNRIESDYKRNHPKMILRKSFVTYNIVEMEKLIKQLKDKQLGDYIIDDRNEYFVVSSKNIDKINEFEKCLEYIFSNCEEKDFSINLYSEQMTKKLKLEYPNQIRKINQFL